MKKSFLIFVLTISFHLNFLSAQNFQMMPMHPQTGEKITLQYDPRNTDLEAMDVYAIAYVLELGESPKAHDVALHKSDNGYTASFQTPSNAQALFFKFVSQDGKKTDNNNGEGYFTKIYKGDKPVKHANVALSNIYINEDLYGIKINASKIVEALEKETTNPSEYLNEEYIKYYAIAVRLNNDEKGKMEIIEHVKSTLAKGNLTEKKMEKLSSLARRVKDNDLSNSINEKMKIEFPNGKRALTAKYKGFRKLESFDEKLAMYEEANSKYGKNESLELMLDNMERSIATTYGKEGDFENMYKYAERLSNIKSEASMYNRFAWNCTGDSINGEGNRVEEGLAMSMKSLKLIEGNMETMDGRWKEYTEREWKDGLESYYASYSDTYALLAYKNGDVNSALKYQKIACESKKMEDIEMNARYAVFMEKGKGEKDALAYLEKMISNGNANPNMKQQFSRLFKANISIDQASEMYLGKLEQEAKAYKVQSLKEEMINKKAPDFALKNLKGEEVSSESLKGKVVVVDFWATWCGPCKASFPGMQKAITKYNQSDDVAFVFVDTWERSKTKEENAQKFIDENNYTFNVLMDNDNEMVSDYGISGIPAKFILDKEGNIRFQNSGFKGSDEELVDEISTMIELVRSEGKSGVQP